MTNMPHIPTSDPTPHQQATDLRIGVLGIATVAVWLLNLTSTQLHTGPGWGPLGLPATIDYAATHAVWTTVVLGLIACALAVSNDPDQPNQADQAAE